MKILEISLFVWSILGTLFYFILSLKPVKRTPQKIAMFILGGPFVWIFVTAVYILDIIAEKVFGPIYRWFTKE